MRWFLDLGTRNKLVAGFGLMIAFLAGVIVIAYAGMTSLQESQRRIYQVEFANAKDLLGLRIHENGVRASLLAMMAAQTNQARETWHQDIRLRSKEVDDTVSALLERNRHDPAMLDQLGAFKTVREEFARTRDQQVIPLINSGSAEQARALALGIQEERYVTMRTITQTLGDAASEQAREAVAASERLGERTVALFTVIGIAALLFGFAMAAFLTRIIATPLRLVSDMARDVARGDLTVDVPNDRRADEVGDLLRAFRDMVTNLRQSTRNLSDGVSVLASSSSEILATSNQVAAGAAQTATAVSETMATVEEVKQTARLASQKARHVSESAQKAAQVSQAGRKSAQEAIAGMQRIQEQMGSITDRIVRLSEQSQVIGEIIAAVNELAEQSNVLAVNAAIEANKAGEQGKGFIIVAQEIKSLAQQSKQATAQVRTILGDVQKATSAAVLAAEHGHKAVETGMGQSALANDAIAQLAESINEAAQAAIQIAASSQQQMVGMDQVALAMDNIRQASTQNVAGTRQAEAAALDLHELGGKLKQLAERYRV